MNSLKQHLSKLSVLRSPFSVLRSPFSVLRSPLSAKPALLAALVLLGAPWARAAGSDILFVLDGSGSMWGQIDGVAKIETAKETLSRLLNDVPGESRLGLMTYGATSKSSCEDVAVLNAIGSDRGAIQKRIAGLKPLGKTPIQASLAQGIALLSRAEPVDTRKSLVLISDGIETCGGDPCAMARTAAASGVDLKLHVVGFDVDAKARAQLQCIAEGGGGQYFNAADTAGFATAMQEVVQVAQAEPEPEPVSQRVFFDDFEGEALEEGDWVVDNRDPDAFIVEDSKLLVVSSGVTKLSNDDPNRFMLKRPVPDGDWDAVITLTAEFKTGRDYIWFGLWTDEENYLGADFHSNSSAACSYGHVNLRNSKRSKGKQSKFEIPVSGSERVSCGSGSSSGPKIYQQAIASLESPFTIGLHKRGRSYHVSMGRDGEDGERQQYETDKLSSLRLPGKALMIAVGKWDKVDGETQAMIDSIEITRVSQ